MTVALLGGYMKKIVRSAVAALLCGAMVLSFTACGKKSDNSASTQKGEVEKIKVFVPTSGATDDLATVLEKVNEITREKINVEVEFTPYQFGQWFRQYSLFLSGTEDVDIIANYGGYLNAVSQGAAYELTDLLPKYGKDIIALEGDALKGGVVDGIQYAVPIYATYAWSMGILYRADVVRELGLEDMVASVKSLEDWGKVLAVVKEKKPNMTPFVRNNGGTTPNFQYGTWDDLGNFYGVLMDSTKSTKVENLFETAEYRKLCEVMHSWYKAGYVSRDIQTQTDGFPTLTQNDAAFSTLGQADFNTSFYQTTTCNREIGVILLGEPVNRTYNNVTYTVMSNSKHPEAAVKFLNLWFSDREVGNLLSYGIEGVHYKLNDKGMGTYLDGQNASNCAFHMGSGISNINRIRWETENPDYEQLLVDFNTNSGKSKALGFAFNTESVTNEITQLDNICSKYQIGLETGALDPAVYLDEFNKALKSAGLDAVIAEKQAQVNAFLK